MAETGSGHRHRRLRRRGICRHEVEASALGLHISGAVRVPGIPAGRALVSVVGTRNGLSDDVIGMPRVCQGHLFLSRVVDAAVAVVFVLVAFDGCGDDVGSGGRDGVVRARRELFEIGSRSRSSGAANALVLN